MIVEYIMCCLVSPMEENCGIRIASNVNNYNDRLVRRLQAHQYQRMRILIITNKFAGRRIEMWVQRVRSFKSTAAGVGEIKIAIGLVRCSPPVVVISIIVKFYYAESLHSGVQFKMCGVCCMYVRHEMLHIFSVMHIAHAPQWFIAHYFPKSVREC